MLGNILSIVISLIIVLAIIGLISKVMYKKADPSVALVVTGPRKSKTIVGRGCLVIPFLQRTDTLTLRNIQADFTSRDEIPTQDAIHILVDAVANFSVSQKPELTKIAASKFVNYNDDQIRRVVLPVLEGNIREIISQTTLKQLILGDKKELSARVMENVIPNLRDLGLELTTFNIQNYKDNNGIIYNLGVENTAQIQKDAAKAKAAADAEVAVAQAKAEKEANDARIAAETEIAIKQNELEIQKAELKKAADIKKAEADAAYKIQEEEQRKTVEITTADANLAKQEKEIELKERAVAIKERELEASIKKTADAERYAVEQTADAHLYETQKKSEADLYERQKLAEAEKFETIQEAEALKAKSEAEKIAMENEAAGIKAQGEAEAAAIQAKAEAEAEGLLKKAEAMEKYGEAAMADMQLEVTKAYIAKLPEIVAAAGQAYTNVDSIYMYGGESSKLTEDIMKNVTQISEGMNKTLGIDLSQIANAFLGSSMANKAKDN